MERSELEQIKKEIDELNKKIIYYKYHYSVKGRLKMARNNERRRNKTKFKKVLKELLKIK